MGHQATASSNPYEHLRKQMSVVVPGQEEPVRADYFDLVNGFSGQYCEYKPYLQTTFAQLVAHTYAYV